VKKNISLLLAAALLLNPAMAADTKISALTDGGACVSTDNLPAVRAGANRRCQPSGFQASDATLSAWASYNTNGILTQTAADTFTGRTLTGTANQITVTNGSGVSGNPTLSTPQDIGTSSTPSFGGLTLTGKGTASVTDTSTAVGGTFSALTFPPSAMWGNMTTNPAGASSAITSGIVGRNVYTSTGNVTGGGHIIGVLGVTDFTNTGDPAWAIPIEGRCNATGTGAEDAESLAVCSSLVAVTDNDASGAGDIAIWIGLYVPSNTDQGHIGSAFSAYFEDPDHIFRNAGQTELNGTVKLTTGQALAGAGTIDPARYIGAKGGNDIAGFGAGGVAQSAGDLWCAKMFAPKNITMDSVAAEVTADGGGDLRYCIYQDSTATGLPGALIEDSGVVTVTGIGIKTDAFTSAVTAGEFWACEVAQGAGLTVDFDSTTDYHETYGVKSDRSTGEASARQSSVTGSCPDPFTGAIVGSSGLTPSMMVSYQ
jgi:hypothetical protein